ncbi:myosin heavy chain, clone 203-like isoform X2 [Watersipora subatra]|uniref:myosin heavy chain, clone 203-like isoform X2 n=1 Tax=Watersipora subatra TaxID=2589382 RepID=UPI00355BAAE4
MALLGTWTIALVSLVAVVFVSRFAQVDQQLERQLAEVIERMELLEHKLDFSTQHLSSTIRDLEIKIHDLQLLQERHEESLELCSGRVEALELWNEKLEKENKKLNQTLNEIEQRLQNHVNSIKASNDKINSLGLADTELKMTDKKLNHNITKTAASLEKVSQELVNLEEKLQESENSTTSSFFELKDALTSYQRKAWKDSPLVIIGAHRENGPWKWTGKVTGLADTLVWGDGKPDRNTRENCVASVPVFADYNCYESHHFVCEQLH